MSRAHGDGGIDERSPGHYRLRWRADGKRFTKSFRGSIGEARKELRRLIKSADDGQHVAPDRVLLGDYLRTWLDADTGISPKTRERYCQLAERQIIPSLVRSHCKSSGRSRCRVGTAPCLRRGSRREPWVTPTGATSGFGKGGQSRNYLAERRASGTATKGGEG